MFIELLSVAYFFSHDNYCRLLTYRHSAHKIFILRCPFLFDNRFYCQMFLVDHAMQQRVNNHLLNKCRREKQIGQYIQKRNLKIMMHQCATCGTHFWKTLFLIIKIKLQYLVTLTEISLMLKFSDILLGEIRLIPYSWQSINLREPKST